MMTCTSWQRTWLVALHLWATIFSVPAWMNTRIYYVASNRPNSLSLFATRVTSSSSLPFYDSSSSANATVWSEGDAAAAAAYTPRQNPTLAFRTTDDEEDSEAPSWLVSPPSSSAESSSSLDNGAKFGDVVSMRRPASTTDKLARPDKSASSSLLSSSLPSSLATPVLVRTSSSPPATARVTDNEAQQAQNLRRRNVVVALLSVGLALANYAWQYTHPLTPIQLLMSMQQQSAPLTVIGRNDKPTLVDFWAPWCENCQLMAPTLLTLEEEYRDQVNFVLVNGDLGESWPTIEAFGVDAIPHLALVAADGTVETALIGPIPKHVLQADLDALLYNAAHPSPQQRLELPYKMLDAFAGRPEASRQVHFDDP